MKSVRKSHPTTRKPDGSQGSMLQSRPTKFPSEKQQTSAVPAIEEFDEDAYLTANPDVAAAVRSGLYRSGHFHYQTVGWQEKRPLSELHSAADNRLVGGPPNPPVRRKETIQLQLTVEAALLSDAGGLMIVGWLDDSELPLDHFRYLRQGGNTPFRPRQ